MSIYEENYFLSKDNVNKVHYNKWLPDDKNVKGIVIIAHGISEYGYRYKDFAEFLASNGFAVYANDHLGHGKSVIEGKPRLFFGCEKGWDNVVDNIIKVKEIAESENKNVPAFLFGHSMGSFLSRTCLINYPQSFKGAILCGTGFKAPFVVSFGKIVTALVCRCRGKDKYSPMVEKLIFGSYNDKFKPLRTHKDWLSKNEINVDNYIKDPFCGGNVTVGLYDDLLYGLKIVNSFKNIEKMDKNKPVFLIAGDCDPVGDMGKGVKKVFSKFKEAGIKDVEIKLYPTLRHEILNEKENKEVYSDILNWILKRM